MNIFLNDFKKIFTIIFILLIIISSIFFFAFLALTIIPLIVLVFFIRKFFLSKTKYSYYEEMDNSYKEKKQKFIDADYNKKEEKDI